MKAILVSTDQTFRKISDDTYITEAAAAAALASVSEPATAGTAYANQTTYSIDFAALTHSAAAKSFDRVEWYDGTNIVAATYDVTWDGTSIVNTSSIVGSPSAGTTNGLLTTYDAQGAAAAGVTLTFAMNAGPGNGGASYGSDKFTAVSDDSGAIIVPLVLGATYYGRRESGRAIKFTVPSNGTSFNLPEILGAAS